MKKELVVEIFISLIALLFAYTAASKLLDYNRFVFQMQLAPLPLLYKVAPVLGIAIPTIELFIVIGLLIKKYRVMALSTTIGLLISFEIYITGMMMTGRHLPCTCGGIISKMGWGQHLIFNMFFILIALTAIVLIRRNNSPVIQNSDRKRTFSRV